MLIRGFLLGLLFVFGYSNPVFAQSLTPKMNTLLIGVTKYTYSNQYKTAQTLVLSYLDDPNLSNIETFYGHFLFADIVKSSGNSQKAINLLIKSKDYLKPIKEKAIFESLIHGNIAECYFNSHDIPSANKHALRSLELSPDSSFRGSGHAVNHLIIGFSFYKTKKYNQAITYYQYAIQEYLAYGEPCELPLCYIKIALVHNAKGKLKQGRSTFEKAISLSDSCDISNYKLLTRNYLFGFLKKQNLHKEALALLEEMTIVQKQIRQKKQNQQFEDLELKYETKLTKKENENLKKSMRIQASNSQLKTILLIISLVALFVILVLGFFILRIRDKKNTALNTQITKIDAQNKERETLLKEVHHRVKNNLQVITSLLSLQAHQIKDSKTIDLFQQSQYRINSMAMVHEMLYQSDDLSGINFEAYLKELVQVLVNSIKGTENNIIVSINSPPVYLGVDTAIPLGLIVNEVLTNALTHGIKDNEAGEVYITLEAGEHPNFTLLIGDNGIGYPEKITFRNSSSLGLRLMYKLSRQLMGSIEKDLSKNGCHYKVAFQEVE